MTTQKDYLQENIMGGKCNIGVNKRKKKKTPNQFLRELISHENFAMPILKTRGMTTAEAVAHTLNCVAAVLSPEQMEFENNEFSCIDLRSALTTKEMEAAVLKSIQHIRS